MSRAQQHSKQMPFVPATDTVEYVSKKRNIRLVESNNMECTPFVHIVGAGLPLLLLELQIERFPAFVARFLPIYSNHT
jgi:hypothetical protein